MKNNIDKKQHNYETLSVIGLTIAALFWGISYPLTKYVEDCPTFYIIALRFAIATVTLSIFLFPHFKNINKATIKYAFILSIMITIMYILNIVGVKYTTAVRSSFFTTLSFLIVPVINWVAYKVRISRIIVISAAICLAGMFMLCYTPEMGSIVVNFGDILCIGASVIGAVNIIYMEKMSHHEDIDSSLFTICLMAGVSLWGVVIGLFTGDLNYSADSSSQIIAIVIMGLLCSAGAFILQIHSERYVPSNRVGIIFSLEPASGCILSVIILHESMSWIGWTGAAVIMISILYMEYANNKKAKLAAAQLKGDDAE